MGHELPAVTLVIQSQGPIYIATLQGGIRGGLLKPFLAMRTPQRKFYLMIS